MTKRKVRRVRYGTGREFSSEGSQGSPLIRTLGPSPEPVQTASLTSGCNGCPWTALGYYCGKRKRCPKPVFLN